MARTLKVVEQPKGTAPRQDKTRRERWRELAEKRLKALLKETDLLKKISNPVHYESTPEERAQIVEKIGLEFEEIKFMLENPGKTRPLLKFSDDE